MNRNWIWIIIFVIAAVGIWWYIHSSQSKKDVAQLAPTINVASISISNISENSIKLNAKILLTNRLPVELMARRVNYEVFIDSVRVIHSSYDKIIKLHSNDSSHVSLAMEILSRPLARVIEKLEKQNPDSADYRLKANFEMDVPIAGERNFNVDIVKRLPVVRIPKGKLEKFKIDKLGIKDSGFEAILHVDNPNVFSIAFYNSSYDIAIDKDLDMEGTLSDTIQIPAKGSQDVVMHLKLKTAKIASFVWKALADKRDTPYTFNFKCILNTDNNIFDNSPMAIKVTGTLDDLKTK